MHSEICFHLIFHLKFVVLQLRLFTMVREPVADPRWPIWPPNHFD